MECPVCNVRLIAVERQGIEVDYCPSCRGFWFDAGEIELLLEKVGDTFTPDVFRAPVTAPRERPRRCPRCGKVMEKIEAGRRRPVLLDRCPDEQGLWFDARELGALLDDLRTESDADETVFNFLGELFGGRKSTGG